MLRLVRASTLRRLREIEARFVGPASPAAGELVGLYTRAVRSGIWVRNTLQPNLPKDTP